MRAAVRLLASVKPGQALEAGAPTGLTGLLTHPSPRSTLLYHYTNTLDKLKQIPASSVYRQSTEALTKHRLAIVEQSKPSGWDEWQEKIKLQVGEDPSNYKIIESTQGSSIMLPNQQEVDERAKRAEWDGEKFQQFSEGIRSSKERSKIVQQMKGDVDYTPERAISQVKFDPEPQYTAEAYVTQFHSSNTIRAFILIVVRIADLESKIGAGLIEEVIQVAEGEHKLVEVMTKAQV